MRLRVMVAAVGGAVVVGVGAALAAHATEIDPATVPTGFFVAHNRVVDFPVSPIARAVQPDGAEVYVQHLSLGPNLVFAWHTHPGPVVVTVRSGSLTYQDAGPNACRDRMYTAGEGFVDPGFGHVHRVIAGRPGQRHSTFFSLPPRRTTLSRPLVRTSARSRKARDVNVDGSRENGSHRRAPRLRLRLAWAAEFGHAISYPLAREVSAEDLVRGLQP